MQALRRVRAPTLVLHGSDDPLVPMAGGEDTAASIPGARLRIVPGMGHFLPEALVPLLVDEIAEHCLDAEDAAQSRVAARRRGFTMKRLSLLDALFLYMETPETPMHVASVTIFKPESPQDDLFARFREHTAARLDLLPSYRRRLEPTPLGIDHPAWVIEDKLDLDYHIRHAALPKPGGMEELRALIAQLHAIPLDRAARCGSTHFIEGLEGGALRRLHQGAS